MAIKMRNIIFFLTTVFIYVGCYTTNETIILCDQKFGVYKRTEYNYEQNLNATYNSLCFKNTRLIAFSYQSAGYRDSDTNLVYTLFHHQNDSLLVTTIYREKGFGDPDQFVRYYRCTAKGLVSLSTNGYPDYFITKKTARKDGRRLKR